MADTEEDFSWLFIQLRKNEGTLSLTRQLIDFFPMLCVFVVLTDLCASLLLSEAVNVNPNDIPQILSDIRQALPSKGIPDDFL